MIYFRYGIPRALRTMRQNPRAALSSVLIIAAALSVLGVIVLLHVNVRHVSEIWLSNSTVSLFLKPGISGAERSRLMETLQRLPMVRSAVEVAPAQGLSALTEKLGADHTLLVGVGRESLPYTIDVEVYLDFRKELGSIAPRLRALPGVDDVIYADREWAKVALFFQLSQALGLFFIGLMVVAFALIVSNAVRLSLYARREEIEILDLVGATRRFIRSAFVVEGVVLSLAGALAALGLVWLAYRLMLAGLSWNATTRHLMELTVFFPPEWMAPAIVIPALLGGLTSRFSVERMLRELEP
ncbi:MAG: FtsX-like permease family protein [Candidatus Lambdaproteobacteria bacterium]|nr:FtsX-like permease family protein [Candidatus Lambdaproteobacteria bacterium]